MVKTEKEKEREREQKRLPIWITASTLKSPAPCQSLFRLVCCRKHYSRVTKHQQSYMRRWLLAAVDRVNPNVPHVKDFTPMSTPNTSSLLLLLLYHLSTIKAQGEVIDKRFSTRKTQAFFNCSWPADQTRSKLECAKTCSNDNACVTYGYACKTVAPVWCCCKTLSTSVISSTLVESGWTDGLIGTLVSIKEETTDQTPHQVMYEIQVVTGSQLLASTASIYLDIYGTIGNLASKTLSSSSSLLASSTTTVQIYDVDVGVLRGIKITVAASGSLLSLSSGWYCNTVTVRKYAIQNIGQTPQMEHTFNVFTLFADNVREKEFWI